MTTEEGKSKVPRNESHMTVIMYSKFSKSCSMMLELLDKIPSFKHTLLCVDNEDIRKRVISDSKLTITEVPCLFRIYDQTGYVESFEGERAFAIVNAHYNHYLEKLEKEELLRSQPPQQSPLPPPQAYPQQIPMQQQAYPQQSPLPPPQAYPQQMPVQQPQQTYPQQIPPQQPQQAYPQQIPPQQPQQAYPQQPQQPPSQSQELPSQGPGMTSMSTPIEDVVDASGMGKQMERAVKINGGGNIVSRALQMQKERESETSTNTGPRPMA
jgi:hypothetical protein